MSATEKELPTSWRRARLDEVCDIVLGQSPPGNTYNVKENGLPFFQGKAEFGDYYPTPVKWCSAPTKIAELDDVLISVRAPVGPTNLCPGRACIGRGLAAIRPRDGMHSRYVLYALRATVGALTEKATGSTFDAVNGSDLRAHFIPVAPLDEQRRIVAKIDKQFTRLEAGVAALKRVQANLKRYRAAILKSACEGKLVPTEADLARKESRTYETGEQLLARILTERRQKWQGRGKCKEPVPLDAINLPTLPEGWTWATMPQLGELNRGKSKHRPRDEARLYGGLYPFVQTGDIRRSKGTIREHTQTYSNFGLQQSRLWPAGTLAITIAANIAETALLSYPACFPDSVVGFIHESEPTIVRYVELFIRTAKEKLAQLAPATAQKNINLNILQKVAIPLPPLTEQERIVAEVERRLSVVEELGTMVSANLQRATRLRQSILQKAFIGNLC